MKMSANIGWLFYREMYSNGESDTHIANVIERLLRANAIDESIKSEYGFKLKTVYPGLLLGSGYTHGISSEKDIKIGFYFDHTSGLPIIPGSSIKGVLRSMFGLAFGNQSDPYETQKAQMIRSLLNKGDDFDVTILAKAIFEGEVGDKKSGMYERDIFYDARIVHTGGNILEDDYITPHRDPLKDPNPIRFLKVTNGVNFAFAFNLVDTKIGEDIITASDKEILFFDLLQWSGVGAKTNVGYGQLLYENEEQRDKMIQRQKNRETKRKIQECDSEAEKVILVIDKYKALNSLYKALKEEKKKLIDLSEEDKDKIKDKLYQNFPDKEKDKFFKRLIKLVDNPH